jgi:hypothetical protein
MAPADRSLVAALLAALACTGAVPRARAHPSGAPAAGDEGDGPLRRRGGPSSPAAGRERASGGEATDEPAAPRVEPADEGPLRRRERLGPGPAGPRRAPRLALWTGGRLGVALPVGDAFKDFDDNRYGEGELVGPGPTIEFDVGARLARTFVPFAFAELTIASAGSARGLPAPGPPAESGPAPPESASPRVDRASVLALGFGFRYEFGPEGLGPALEIAYAFRRTSVTFNTGQALALEAPGEVRLGLGASWRAAESLTLSPLVTVAVGSYADATIKGFDGRERAVATEAPLHGYLGLSVGGHVDLFAKRLGVGPQTARPAAGCTLPPA